MSAPDAVAWHRAPTGSGETGRPGVGKPLAGDPVLPVMTEEHRKGLLDEVEELHERRSKKKAAKKEADLDLDKVW